MIDADTSSLALKAEARQQLLALARTTILRRLRGEKNLTIALQDYQPELRRHLASFVTLKKSGRLRGCIGNLSASQPLVQDVAHNAAAAAFDDPRFAALSLDEYAELDVHISVLSEPREVAVTSRDQLLQRLQPGVDGVVLQQGRHRATYLPSVWEQLPDPEQFVSELRRKAGLPGAGWDHGTQVSIYHSCEFGAETS